MGDTGPFSPGDKVMVPHTDKYYEAKCVKARRGDDGLWYYLLHYPGWSKSWDEWVEETGVYRVGDELPALIVPPDALLEGGGGPGGGGADAADAPAGAGGPVKTKRIGPAGAARAGVRGAVASRASKPGGHPSRPRAPGEPELPARLKQRLLDEHSAIHEDGKLLPLPRSPTVAEVLQRYVAYVAQVKASSALSGAAAVSAGTTGFNAGVEAEEDLVAGLRVYFDKALVQSLLYTGEHEQAEQVLAGGRLPSCVYGAEHLLRLFVKLPALLPHTGMTIEQMQALTVQVEDLLDFLQAHQQKFFVSQDSYEKK